jgi:transcriptional regulator with XRE-family HTH domain
MSGERFGAFVRREREAKEIGLREMAKMIGVSPTYLSKVERDEFPPPVEDKVKAIAKIINCDADELLARAGRVSSDLSDIIKRQPGRAGSAAADHQGSQGRGYRPAGLRRAEGEGQVMA